jgi:predicted DNA-binding protein
MPKTTVAVQLEIPREVHTKLKALCQEEGRKFYAYLVQLIVKGSKEIEA